MFTAKGYIRVLKDGYTLSQHRQEREAIEAIVTDVEADPESTAKYEIQHPTVEVDVSRIRRGVLKVSISTIPLISQTGTGTVDLSQYVVNPRGLPWAITSVSGLPAGVSWTETALVFDGSSAGSSSNARVTIVADGKTLKSNFFTVIADVESAEPPADVTSRLWPQPLLAGTVDITLYPEASGTYTTAFGIPFPRGYLSSVNTVVLKVGGVEVATDVVEICRWRHTSGNYDSVRSVLIYYSRTWTAGTPVSATVEWGTTRTLSLGSGTPQVRTLWQSFPGVQSDEFSRTDSYPAALDLQEPKVYQELPATWLSRCMLRSKAQPFAESDVANPLFGDYMRGYGRTYALDVDETVSGANLTAFEPPGTNRETWEYDRPQAFMNVHVLSGAVKWLRHFHRAAEFYRNYLIFTGTNPGFAYSANGTSDYASGDRKYLHSGGTFLQYLFTGDSTCIADIEGIGALQRILRDYGTTLADVVPGGPLPAFDWTERHWTYYFLGQVYEWAATGSTVCSARIEFMLSTLAAEAAGTGYGVLLHTITDHEGDISDDLIVSPWMATLLTEALWVWYLHSSDSRCLRLIVDYARFIAHYGCPVVPSNAANSSSIPFRNLRVPWYLVATHGETQGYEVNSVPNLRTIQQADTNGVIGVNGMAEHAPDVACLMERGVFAAKLLGEDSATINAVGASLYQASLVLMDIEQNDANTTIPDYRLRLGNWRRYNAWFGSATDFWWFQNQNVTLPTLTANSPSVTEGNSGTKNLSFVYTQLADSSVETTIAYETQNGTATGGAACTTGVDYITTSGTALIPVGQTQTTVNVSICGDTVIEPDETLHLRYPGTTDSAVSRAYGVARTPVAVDVTAPRTPVAPTLSVVNSSQIDLTWPATIDDLKPPSTFASGVLKYRVWQSPDDVNYTLIGEPTTGNHAAGGLAPSTPYWFKTSAVDVAGNESPRSTAATATTNAAAITSSWPTQSPSFQPVIPGTTGWGANQFGGSGRHLGTPQTYVLFVDRKSSGSAGGSSPGSTNGSLDTTNRRGYGSLEWCLTRTVPRVIIPLVGGLVDHNDAPSTSVIASAPYMTYAGQCAPTPGLYSQDMRFVSGQLGGGLPETSHVLWHMTVFHRDQWAASSGDPMSHVGQRIFLMNCTALWSNDEQIAFTGASQDPTDFASAWHCLIAESVGETEDGNGHGLLCDNNTGHADVARCLFVHSDFRTPLMAGTPLSTVANNVVYNWQSGALEYDYRGVNMEANAISNCYLYHPTRSSPFQKPIRRADSTNAWNVANCELHASGNRQLHWSGHGPTSEGDLYSGVLPATDPVNGPLLTNAYPSGFAPYSDLGTLGANDGKRETFIDLVCAEAGARPKERPAAIQRLIDHVQNAKLLNGGPYHSFNNSNTGPTLAQAQSIADSSLIPELNAVTASIADPFTAQAAWGGRSVPTLAQNRDVPYTSGTFSDGKSRVGYTRLEEFLYEVHLLVMS